MKQWSTHSATIIKSRHVNDTVGPPWLELSEWEMWQLGQCSRIADRRLLWCSLQNIFLYT